MLIAIPNATHLVDYQFPIQKNKWVQLRKYTQRENLENLTANYVRNHSCKQFSNENRLIAPGIAEQIQSDPDRLFGTLYAISCRSRLDRDTNPIHYTTALAEDDFDLQRMFKEYDSLFNIRSSPFYRFMHPHIRLCNYMGLIGEQQ